ncbi:hypothetical protein NDU88_002538 [Pleurodeles waltl]|uniref:Uncharacterized protein n=1 Tax=Pleurodeles waltl TaxID=8319 RepID=A0AAV7L3U2_PLEWA|nr:hypothetical protein NDU88_002538 [Pleurodeles waltl]
MEIALSSGPTGNRHVFLFRPVTPSCVSAGAGIFSSSHWCLLRVGEMLQAAAPPSSSGSQRRGKGTMPLS